MPKIHTYFCNANPNKLHALALMIQFGIMRNILIKIKKHFEKSFNNFLVPFPAFLLNFLKPVFHTDSILSPGCFSCLVGDFMDY